MKVTSKEAELTSCQTDGHHDLNLRLPNYFVLLHYSGYILRAAIIMSQLKLFKAKHPFKNKSTKIMFVRLNARS